MFPPSNCSINPRNFPSTCVLFDSPSLSDVISLVQSLGLSEFSEVLANPPPGIDELVALSRVLKLARSEE